MAKYACCKCCEEGVDPDLHSDPEFDGHDIECDLCREYSRYKEAPGDH